MPQINIDGILEKGKLHKVCEDYIVWGTFPVPHIILSDGCSSSKNVDIGSRILVHSAQIVLREYSNRISDFFVVSDIGKETIKKASDVAYSLGLPQTCLDCTLIIAYVDQEVLRVIMYGDGYVFVRSKNVFRYEYLEFAENCPYYLSYELEPQRCKAHEKKVGNGCSVVVSRSSVILGETDGDRYLRPHNFIYAREFPIQDVEYLAISSDGIGSFMDTKKGGSIAFSQVAHEFLSFKNLAGEFVQRRVGRALKDYKKENIESLDDLSFGVFHITQEEENSSEG